MASTDSSPTNSAETTIRAGSSGRERADENDDKGGASNTTTMIPPPAQAEAPSKQDDTNDTPQGEELKKTDSQLQQQQQQDRWYKVINRNWIGAMDTLREAVSYVVLVVANHAATYPVSYVVGICVFSFALVGIGLFTNFDMSASASESYTPVHSVINEQNQWIAEESEYPPNPHSLRILIHRSGENVLTTDGGTRTFDVVDRIQNTSGYQSFCNETERINTYGFGGLCHIRGLPLLWNTSRDIYDETVVSDLDVMLAVSAEEYPDGSFVEPRELLGHMVYLNDTFTFPRFINGGRPIIQTAESFLMEVVVPDNDVQVTKEDGSVEVIKSWSLAIEILEELQDLRNTWKKHGAGWFQLELFLVEHSLEAESVRSVFYDLPLIPSVFVVMALFTYVVFSTSHKPGSKKFESRFMLGFGAVATIVMSLATSHGLLFIIGVPFTSLTQMLPFVMFGIGLDDAFIIYGEFIRTEESKPTVDRIRDTFEEVGLSIFLTTVTTTLAFGLGCLQSMPTLIWLSTYAFPTVIIDFIYQITFFVAIIVIDERRIAKRKKLNEEKEQEQARMQNISNSQQPQQKQLAGGEEKPEDSCNSSDDLAVLEGCDSALKDTAAATTQNKNVGDVADPDPEVVEAVTSTDDRESQSGSNGEQQEEDEEEEQELVNSKQYAEHHHFHHHIPGPPASSMDRFMRRYADVLLTKPAKMIVLVAFVTLTVLLAYAASNFRQEFNIYEVLLEDSYLSAYFRNLNMYADTGFGLAKAYFRNVDQSDPDVQKKMYDFIDDLVQIESITRPPPFFWLDHFKEFLTYDDRLLDLTFNQQMDIFLSVDVFKTLYGDHIVRNEDGDITTSRVLVYMDNIDVESVSNQIGAWRAQLNVTEKQPINAEPNLADGDGFNFFLHDEELLYAYEFYSKLKPDLINSSVLGVITVTLVTFLFLPHWSAVFILSPIISILYIDLIGFLQVCGVSLNGITYFVLVMSIGLLVDFNMHILLRYYESPCCTREAKVKDALQTMGSSVLVGGLSTWLGVVPLLFSTSSLMKTVFYGFWGMVLLGCGHGVIVLPVILSYVGTVETYTINTSPTTPSDGNSASTQSTQNTEDTKKMTLQNTPMSTFCTTSPSCDSSTGRAHLESDGDLSAAVSSEKQAATPSISSSQPGITRSLLSPIASEVSDTSEMQQGTSPSTSSGPSPPISSNDEMAEATAPLSSSGPSPPAMSDDEMAAAVATAAVAERKLGGSVSASDSRTSSFGYEAANAAVATLDRTISCVSCSMDTTIPSPALASTDQDDTTSPPQIAAASSDVVPYVAPPPTSEEADEGDEVWA